LTSLIYFRPNYLLKSFFLFVFIILNINTIINRTVKKIYFFGSITIWAEEGRVLTVETIENHNFFLLEKIL
jgi:hypothetical protein